MFLDFYLKNRGGYNQLGEDPRIFFFSFYISVHINNERELQEFDVATLLMILFVVG